MFVKSSHLYDAIYGGLNYEGTAQVVHSLIQQYKQSEGSTLLDVACGTGVILPYLKPYYTIEGLDLDPNMVAISRKRHPDLTFYEADMADFDLGRQYDVITCLGSAIGSVRTIPMLQSTLQSMSRHTKPGGVVLIEPWLTPDVWEVGRITADLIDQPDLKIARMNIAEAEDGLAVLNFHYLVATPEGIEHFTERLELGMFTHEDYLDAFRASGLEVVYDSMDGEPRGRGMLVGRQ